MDSRGDVYVVDTPRQQGVSHPLPEVVDVYGPGVFLPTVVAGVVGERRAHSALLSGSVNPEGFKLSECEFQYVSQEAFAKEGFAKPESVECEPHAAAIPANNEANPVHALATGLTPGVTYHYRLVAHSEGTLGGTEASSSLAFTDPAPAKVEAETAQEVSSSFADLAAKIGPLGADTSYFFEYGPTSAYGQDAPVLTESQPRGVDIGPGGPAGDALENVVQHVAGLAADGEYHFRVVAQSECEPLDNPGHVCLSYGPDQTFLTLAAPVPGLPDGRAYELVTPAAKEGGTDMFAEHQTKGQFESKQDNGAPSEDGEGFLLETRSAFGPFPGAVRSSYVFKRAPGGWAYSSLASPALGVQVPSDAILTPDFSRVAFNDALGASVGAEGEHPADALGAPGGPYTLLSSEDPPFRVGDPKRVETTVVGASRDLGHVILESNRDSACGPAGVANKVEEGTILCEWAGGFDEGGRPELSLVNLAPASQSKPASTCGAQLGASGTVGGGEGGVPQLSGPAFRAVSADGSRVFFTAPAWEESRGASVTSDLSGPGCWNHQEEVVEHKLPNHAPQLYARVSQVLSGELVHQTLKVSAAEAGVEEEGHAPREYPALFVGASEDGSRVFFLTRGWVTKDHTEAHDLELYECEIVTPEGEAPGCRLTRVSAGAPGFQAAFGTGTVTKESAEVAAVSTASGAFVVGRGIEGPGIREGTTITAVGPGTLTLSAAATASGGAVALRSNEPDVQFVAAVSADGSSVYFAASGVLAAGAAPGPANVYRYQTQTGTTSYVAAVGREDYYKNAQCVDGSNAFRNVGSCALVNWNTTPDGEFLLFQAEGPLDGYNTTGAECAQSSISGTEGAGTRSCTELYRYDARAAEAGRQAVVCVSCGPGDADAAGMALFDRAQRLATATGAVRAMSDNGEYVFFDSPAKLVPQAENHTLAVYEWHNGRISLISSPSDPEPSYFLGYAPYEYTTAAGERKRVEGGNVFFGTHARLVPQDTNTGGDVYDARICQPEAPCIPPPAGETAQCSGGSCQTPPPAPVDQTPASQAFSGPGNLTPVPALGPKPPTAAEVRAKKLAVALKLCRRKRNRHQRKVCEASAQKKYGAKKSARKASHKGRVGR